MKLSKILSTSVAIGAFAFAASSFAVPMSLTIDTSSTGGIEYSYTGNDALLHTTLTGLNPLADWSIDVSTAVSGTAPNIFNLNSIVTGGGNGSFLTIIAEAYGFTDTGTLSSLNTAIANNNLGATSTTLEIDYGLGWVAPVLSSFNSSQSDDADFYNLASPSQAFDLRIVQVFAGTGSASTQVNIPEPSIIALLGFGLVGMGVATRRKQKAA